MNDRLNKALIYDIGNTNYIFENQVADRISVDKWDVAWIAGGINGGFYKYTGTASLHGKHAADPTTMSQQYKYIRTDWTGMEYHDDGWKWCVEGVGNFRDKINQDWWQNTGHDYILRDDYKDHNVPCASRVDIGDCVWFKGHIKDPGNGRKTDVDLYRC